MKTIFFFFLLIFIISCQQVPNVDKSTTIGLQPYGKFNKGLIDTIKSSIETVYGFNVCILSSQNLPKSAYTTLRKPRYRADSLLRHLRRIKPDTIDYILGLTLKDISTTKRTKDGKIKQPEKRYIDWGIFGLGFCPGESCVVSNYRLKLKNIPKYLSRIKKICVHEIGHNLGLPHCNSHPKCVMRDAAETIKTIDNVKLWLCDACKEKIGL